MVNNLSYELIDTVEDEGFYPERAIIMEESIKNPGGPTVCLLDLTRKMARFLTTIPSNSGFYNLGSVEAIQPVVQALLHMDQPLTMDLIPVLHSVEIAYITLLIWAVSLLYFARYH